MIQFDTSTSIEFVPNENKLIFRIPPHTWGENTVYNFLRTWNVKIEDIVKGCNLLKNKKYINSIKQKPEMVYNQYISNYHRIALLVYLTNYTLTLEHFQKILIENV